MFKITIEEIREVKRTVNKRWVKLGTKEVPREKQFWESRTATEIENPEPKTRLEDVMGYAPPAEEISLQEVKVLEQTVGTLDLAKVIRSINNL